MTTRSPLGLNEFPPTEELLLRPFSRRRSLEPRHIASDNKERGGTAGNLINEGDPTTTSETTGRSSSHASVISTEDTPRPPRARKRNQNSVSQRPAKRARVVESGDGDPLVPSRNTHAKFKPWEDTHKRQQSLNCSVLKDAVGLAAFRGNPEAIYQRYVKRREEWYKLQSDDARRTDAEYRKALGLPTYDEISYQWCLERTQMGKCCRAPGGARDWTEEEKLAYLDWDTSENNRIYAQVADEISSSYRSSKRQGVDAIWEAIKKDMEQQEALCSSSIDSP